jgi:hypothetical protein
MDSGIVMMKQLARAFSANCIPKIQKEFQSTMINSHFHYSSENGLTVLHENPKTRTVSITFPADGVTLNFEFFDWKVNWDVSIALKHTLIRVGSDAPMIHPSNYIVKHIFSFFCISLDSERVAGFPPRRPRFKPGSGHVGFCDGQKWRLVGFLRELRFPLPIYSPSASPQSCSLSPEAGTIGQEWPQCR